MQQCPLTLPCGQLQFGGRHSSASSTAESPSRSGRHPLTSIESRSLNLVRFTVGSKARRSQSSAPRVVPPQPLLMPLPLPAVQVPKTVAPGMPSPEFVDRLSKLSRQLSFNPFFVRHQSFSRGALAFPF